MKLLPINAVVSFGALEAGWTARFMLIGFNKELAIATGFSMHILVLLFATILAAYGAIGLNLNRKSQASRWEVKRNRGRSSAHRDLLNIKSRH